MTEVNKTIQLMTRIRIVLVRPQVPGNIGAVARLMENFNAGKLYLVDPKADHLSPEALHRSTHGQPRLQSANVVSTLAEALEGAACTVGTSRKPGPVHQPQDLTPRDLHQLIHKHINNGDLAILFGTEDKGLSREELLACDCLVQIPAQPQYPTLNLSHAAAVCLYEIFLAVAGKRIDQASKNRQAEPADSAIMNRLIEKLQHALYTIGYLHPQKPDHLMFPIRAILSRAHLTRTEAQILIGLTQQIDEFATFGQKHKTES